VRARLGRITADKPPIARCPEDLRASVAIVEQCTAPSPPRYRVLRSTCPPIQRVAYQLETIVQHSTQDTDGEPNDASSTALTSSFTKGFVGNMNLFKSAVPRVADVVSPSARFSGRDVVRQRRAVAQLVADREKQQVFDTAEGVLHFPQRRSKFFAGLRVQSERRSAGLIAHTVVSDAPPLEWVVDLGFEDDPNESAAALLQELRKTIALGAIVTHTVGGGHSIGGTETCDDVKERRALFVTRFTFVDWRIPPTLVDEFVTCFLPHRCEIELTFQRCNFSDAPTALRALGERCGNLGVTALKFAFCKGLPLMTGRDGLELALQPHLACLRALSFRGTFLGRHGASGLAQLLGASTWLVTLDVAHTGLDDEAVRQLADGIGRSRSLEQRNLDGTTLAHGIGGDLFHAVKRCPTLVELSANGVDRAATRFQKLLAKAARENAEAVQLAARK
jgi:hypothetical protein